MIGERKGSPRGLSPRGRVPGLTVVCLDLATTNVGYVVGCDGEYLVCFERRYSGPLYKHLDRIQKDVEQLCCEHLATVVAAERPARW